MKSYSRRLEICFIFVLSSIILLFYLYPRFWKTSPGTSTVYIQPYFLVIETPPIIPFVKQSKTKPLKPTIPVEFEDEDILPFAELSREETQNANDSEDTSGIRLFYYSRLFPLDTLKPFNPDSIKKKSREPLFQYKQYLAYKLSRMHYANAWNSDDSNPALADYMNKAMRRNGPMVGISFSISGAMRAASKLFKPEITKDQISADNILSAEKHFYILEPLWYKNPQTITDLYCVDDLNKNCTMSSLQKSLDTLVTNGLIKESITNDGIIEYSPVFIVGELIETVIKFLDQIPEDPNLKRERLYLVLSRLIENT